ncbi:uncharacterized protein WM277_019519 isoform 1-T1 [Molossus nigricans]
MSSNNCQRNDHSKPSRRQPTSRWWVARWLCFQHMGKKEDEPDRATGAASTASRSDSRFRIHDSKFELINCKDWLCPMTSDYLEDQSAVLGPTTKSKIYFIKSLAPHKNWTRSSAFVSFESMMKMVREEQDSSEQLQSVSELAQN